MTTYPPAPYITLASQMKYLLILATLAAMPLTCNHTSGGGHAEPAFHVPALTPTNKHKGDHPPRLRKKPLPPV